jgi:hypothetical protein
MFIYLNMDITIKSKNEYYFRTEGVVCCRSVKLKRISIFLSRFEYRHDCLCIFFDEKGFPPISLRNRKQLRTHTRNVLATSSHWQQKLSI